MKKIVALVVLLSFSLPAAALEDGQVMYMGGTVPNLKEGVVGKLDTTQELLLGFEHAGGKLTIPFAKIESFEYTEKLARHLGVLLTIAVVLVKHRQRRHFFRITYRDDANMQQVAVFEVPKEMPQTLNAVLQARVPHDCKAQANLKCGHRN